MDPVSVILSALVTAGANVAGDAVSDAYQGLKGLILRKFGGADPRLEERIDDYVGDQETHARPAEKALRDVGAADDQEILDLAVEVLRQAERAEPGVTGGLVGKIDAAGGRIAVAHTVHGGIHFDSRGG